MLPPTLKLSVVVDHVAPLSEDLMMAPLFGSHEFVYMPTAAYTLSASFGSSATASIPHLFQLESVVMLSVTAVQESSALSLYRPCRLLACHQKQRSSLSYANVCSCVCNTLLTVN